jgi:hypothetical protein
MASELRKVKTGCANPGVTQLAEQVDARALLLSVIRLREQYLGALLRSWLETCVVPALVERFQQWGGSWPSSTIAPFRAFSAAWAAKKQAWRRIVRQWGEGEPAMAPTRLRRS